MGDNDLDKYLEDLGISMTEEEAGLPEPLERDARSEEVAAEASRTGQLEGEVVVGVPRLEGDPAERTEAFLVDLLLNFDPAYAVEVSGEGGELRADIFGGDPGKIIGRGGRTLQALEYLTNAVLNRHEGDNLRVTVDVGGYKRRRDERLRALARKIADEVRATGEPVELQPMSAVERRVIHVELAEDPSVSSASTGEGRDRRVVVSPS